MRRDKISSFSLLALLFISRLMSRLIYIPPRAGPGGGWDEILLTIVSFAANALLFLPALFLEKSGGGVIRSAKSPAARRLSASFYAVLFVFAAVQTIARFDFFATLSMSSRPLAIPFSLLLSAAACYAALLGLTALSRAGCVIGFLMALSLTALSAALWQKYDVLSMEPPFSHSAGEMSDNLIHSSFLMPETAVAAVLSDSTRGGVGKKYFAFLAFSAAAVCAVAFIPAAVFGQAADTRLFALFQCATVADFGSLGRLDPIIVSLWIGGAFVKASLFLASAVISVWQANGNVKKRPAAVFFAAVTAFAAWRLSRDIGLVSSPALNVIEQVLTGICAAAVPLAALIRVQKRKKQREAGPVT